MLSKLQTWLKSMFESKEILTRGLHAIEQAPPAPLPRTLHSLRVRAHGEAPSSSKSSAATTDGNLERGLAALESQVKSLQQAMSGVNLEKASADRQRLLAAEDKAFWVQDEMMKASPQDQRADLEELAHLEKDAGRYHQAMEHMNESAQLDPDVGSRLWKRMYWAWFVQLQNGNTAGVE